MDLIDVVGYARVSTLKDEQIHSFESQKLFFEETIKRKYTNFNLVHIYADKKTATRFKRPEFLQMLDDAGITIKKDKESGKLSFNADRNRKPKFKYILVSNLSRFARDTLAIDPIRELINKGVYLIFLDSGKSTENDDDMMFIEMMFTFAANESRDKSIKLRDALDRTASRGVLFQNGSLFGYDYIVGEKKLVINEGEAATVRKIFELYINGEGFRRIAEYSGLTNRNGKKFGTTTLKRIISNEKYMGTLIRNKWDTGVVFNKHSGTIKHSDYVFEDAIPAIIDKETFLRAQSIRTSNVNYKNNKGVYKGKSIYSGLLRCNKCGANYTRNIDKGRIFFNCSTKKSRGTKECNALNFNANHLDEAVEYFADGGLYETIDEFKSMYQDEFDSLRENLISKYDKQDNSKALMIKTKIDELKMKQKKLLNLYLDDSIDKETLDQLNSENTDQLNELQNEYQKVSMSNNQIYNEINELETALKQIVDFTVSKLYSIDEIIELIDHVKVKSTYGIYEANGDFVDTPYVLLLFVFKPMQTLIEFADKYLENDSIITFESITWSTAK